MIPRVLAIVWLAVLAGCGSQTQILMEAPTPDLRLRPAVASVEVRDISLPRYAAADSLVVRTTDNALQQLSGTVWADNPERSMTLQLASDLGTITGVRVAAEPWPFADLPSAQVVVRVDRLIGQLGGTLRFSGQYAIAPVGADVSDRLSRFDITVRVPGETAGALALAQGTALAQLSEQIARDLAR